MKSLEEFFELFNLTSMEVFEALYEAGLIEEDLLEALCPSDF
jgi:hypothetical protein